jgi:hypothetical protein
MKNRLWKIRLSGKPLDITFGLMTHDHPSFMDPLWTIVWLDTLEQAAMTGSFFNKDSALNYIKEHREQLIDKQFEKIILD